MKVLIPNISVHCLQLFKEVYVYIPTHVCNKIGTVLCIKF